MCGICGYIGKREIKRDILEKMNDTMTHRGPDDSGVEIFEGADGYTIGLAHRRLSIMDLSPSGHQPMTSFSGRTTIVFNGEIYNFQDLKLELTGYPFRSSCDTEVILAAYERWGIEFIKKLNGMFAIAIFDREKQDVYLIRDRIGKKPLYYWCKNDELVFASELKPIMAFPGFNKEINSDILPRYLYQQYISGPESIFKNVYKLMPGCFLCFRAGEIDIKKYWDVKEKYSEGIRDQVGNYDEAKSSLKLLLQEATARRMIADVPIGTFLSGGYDSSLISAIAQEYLGSEKLKTFSIGVKDKRYDEALYAREIAAHIGSDHTELYIDVKDMMELVKSIPYYYDEPMADSSQIPTMLVSQLAKEKVTVALSGDAGDEFYCGYKSYDTLRIAQKMDCLGSVAHFLGKLPCHGKRLEDRYPLKFQIVSKNRNKNTKTQLKSSFYEELVYSMVKRNSEEEKFPVKYKESGYKISNWQIRKMLLDMDTYLPDDILVKVDRASMKYSLENRCPMLDVNVMEYSFRIPHRFKYKSGEKKYILKDLAYDYIPIKLLDRPKMGFSIPITEWLRNPLADQLREYSDPAFLKNQNLFEAEYVNKMVDTFIKDGDAGAGTGRNFSNFLWAFFVFQMWYDVYMK